MTINNAGNAAAAEAARRAAEAARKAAEEARRKAEAQKKAQEAAQKAAEQREAKSAATELGSKDAEKDRETAEGGLFGGVIDKVKGIAETQSLQAQVDKIKPAEAKKDLAAIREDMRTAKNPQDLQKITDRAAELQGRASVSGGEDGLDKDLADSIEHMRNKTDRANKAIQKIDSLSKGMDDPAQRAANTAELLARPQEFQKAMGDLRMLKGSDALKGVQKDLDSLGKKATPEALAKQLQENPDLSKYPPTMAADLAALQGSGHPELQKGIDAVGTGLLNREGGVTYDQVKADPNLGKLMANLQNSQDPAVKAKLDETVKGWAQSGIDANLDGKEGEDGVKDAMSAFEGEMVDLANKTGLGPTIGKGAQAAAGESQDKFEDVVNEGKSWFDKAKDAVGDFVGDIIKNPLNIANPAFMASNLVGGVAGVVGADGLADTMEGIQDTVGKPLDVAQGVLGDGLALAGKGLSAGFDVLGEGINGAMDLTGKAFGGLGKLGAGGLDAIGLDGAADVVRDGSDFVENAYDKVGDVGRDFTKGFGDGVGGTAAGLGFMVKDPVGTMKGLGHMVTNPGEVAKAMWSEASKHGPAGAVGYITANALPMLVGGGQASLVGKLGTLGAKSSSTTAQALGNTALKVADKGAKVAELTDFVGNLSKAPGVVGKLDELRNPAAAMSRGEKLMDNLAATKNKLTGFDPDGAASQVKNAAGDLRRAHQEDGLRAAAAKKLEGKNLADLSRDYHTMMQKFSESPLGRTLGFVNEVQTLGAGPLGYIGSKVGGLADDALGVSKVVGRQDVKAVVEESTKTVQQAEQEAIEEEANR